MRRLLAACCVVTLALASAFAQQPEQPKQAETSPLLAKGFLNEVNKPIELIFQFNIEKAKLTFDRRGWDTAAKGMPKPKDPFGGRIGNEPPAIEAIFNQVQEAAGPAGRGMSIGGEDRRINFSSGKLGGLLHTRKDYVRMSLEETQAPQRTLEVTIDGSGAYRIQLAEPEGDMVLLSQAKNGRFTVVAVVADKTFTARGESFAAFFKEHRKGFDTHVLPVLDAMGIRPVPASSSEKVRKAVVALLSRTPETLAEGKKLLDDLDSEEFAVRQKAATQLTDRYAIYQDLIQERLKEKLTLDVQKRLEKIVNEHADASRISQALTSLGLLQDPAYLISLLDHVTGDEAAPLTAQLEKTTGEKLGKDVAAWKEWGKKNLK